MLKEEMCGDIHSHHTAIPPQLYNIIAQTIFKGLLLTLVEVSNTVAVKKSYLLQKQLYIS